MSLIKYDNFWNDPFADVDQLLDRAYNLSRLSSPTNSLFSRSFKESFRVDVYDDADNYYVLAELPGVEKGDLDIQLENAILSISGERKFKTRNEESTLKFARSLTIADDINTANVSAKLEDGVLKITLPKAEERKPKAISVS
jgi:HSP20 family protein